MTSAPDRVRVLALLVALLLALSFVQAGFHSHGLASPAGRACAVTDADTARDAPRCQACISSHLRASTDLALSGTAVPLPAHSGILVDRAANARSCDRTIAPSRAPPRTA